MSASDNLPEVLNALKGVQAEMEKRVSEAAEEVSKQLAGDAMRQIKGDRKNKPYPAISGQPPMNVTGNLRRSIKGESKRKGFGLYVAEVGAYMVYARAVELGGAPTWKNGQKFPYLQPALEKFKQSQKVQRILIKHLRGR